MVAPNLTRDEAWDVINALEKDAHNNSDGERLEELLELAFRKFELPIILNNPHFERNVERPEEPRVVEDVLHETEDTVESTEYSDNGFAFSESIAVYPEEVENISEMQNFVVAVAHRAIDYGWTVKDYDDEKVVIVPDNCGCGERSVTSTTETLK